MYFIERPQAGIRAVLVHIDLNEAEAQERFEEFRELTVSAGAIPVAAITGARKTPDPKFFVGTGKAEEIKACVQSAQADVVLVNHALSPAQERNLEGVLKCRVLDRTGLILDIFAQRARSFEGKLQVELAQLRHLSSRLVRGWTHLERQKGGIGLRGPGETQLETDRRLIWHRIKQLNRRLQKLETQRHERRRSRQKSGMPTLSLVGYTNAGKSTLFNRLTGAGVYAADQLFATLDPTLRRVDLPGGRSVIMADTVGFIRHLPHNLVAAFHSTLEETREATLLLHVIDAASEGRDDRIEQVNEVLAEIGANDVPQIEVFNKIDLLEGGEARVDRDEAGRVRRVWLSSKTGAGLELLREALAAEMDFYLNQAASGGNQSFRRERRWLRLAPMAGNLRSRLYTQGRVLAEEITEVGDWLIELEICDDELEALTRIKGCVLEPEPIRYLHLVNA